MSSASDASSALRAGLLIFAVGMMAHSVQLPWLFPSLGPTAMLMVDKGQNCRPYNVLVGHGAGVLAGLSTQWLSGGASPLSTGEALSLWSALACGISTLLTVYFNRVLKTQHAPAVATTLLIALGGIPSTPTGIGSVFAGVGLLVGMSAGLSMLQEKTCGRV